MDGKMAGKISDRMNGMNRMKKNGVIFYKRCTCVTVAWNLSEPQIPMIMQMNHDESPHCRSPTHTVNLQCFPAIIMAIIQSCQSVVQTVLFLRLKYHII